jgi:hypothetical protein
MTRDEFRKHQKPLCRSGAPNRQGIYGCPCCRKVSNTNEFKKFARKTAKTKLRAETQREIRTQIRDDEHGREDLDYAQWEAYLTDRENMAYSSLLDDERSGFRFRLY